MKHYIYQIWFPTSKKSYIGQTKDLKKRMESHLKSGSLVCKALWKYDDWQVTILHTTSKELVNQLEIEDIRNFNSVAPNGYNLTRGGEGGDTFTNNPNKEITREKRRKLMKGNKITQGMKHSEKFCKNISKKMQGNKNAQGMKHTKESKNKISVALMGNKHSEGIKHTEEWKQNHSERMRGINNSNYKNGECTKEAKIKRLKTRIRKLEE